MISPFTGIQIGPPPVGVAAEHAGVRLGGKVLDLVLLAAKVEHKGMLEVIFRQRANAVGTEELVLVEHVGQNALQFLLVDRPTVSLRPAYPPKLGRRLTAICLHHLRMPLAEQLNQFEHSGMIGETCPARIQLRRTAAAVPPSSGSSSASRRRSGNEADRRRTHPSSSHISSWFSPMRSMA